tara:strand:+ start:30510 stop:32759 length:2250 start_codon:yes stop_codon:yes gene_type:complete
MNLCVNAVNIRSKGGIVHLQNFINYSKHSKFSQITIWISKETSKKIKISSSKKIKFKNCNFITGSFIYKFFYFNLYYLLKKYDAFYSLDGVSIFAPKSIIFFQNLLPFDNYEIIRHGISIKTFKFFILGILYKISYLNSIGRVYLNSYCKKFIEKKYSVKDKNFYIVPHGISNKFQITARIKKNKILKLLYVSNFEIYKNHLQFMEGLLRFNKNNHNLNLEIIFAGDYTDYQLKIKILKLSEKFLGTNISIKILNNCNSSKIKMLMSQVDGIVFCSSCESFGFPILEAMQSKKPLFCSEKCDFKNLTQNQAIYFNPFNVDQIAKKFNHFLNNVDKCKIKNNYSFSKFKWKENITKNLNGIWNLSLKKNDYKKKVLNINFNFNFSFRYSYLVNSYIINLLFLNLFIKKQYDFINTYLFISSVALFFFSVFSGNQKNELLKNFSNIYFLNLIKIRLIIVFLILIFSLIIFQKFDFYLTVFTVLFVGSTWLFDIVLVKLEKKNQVKIIKNYIYLIIFIFTIFNVIFYLGHISSFITLIIFLSLFYIVLIYYLIFDDLNKKFFSYEKINFNKFLDFSYISSYSLNFFNLILRIIILYSFSEKASSEIILGLAFLSLPQTLIANAIGPSYIYSRKDLPFYLSILNISYFIMFCYLLIFEKTNLQIAYNQSDIKSIFIVSFFCGILSSFSQFVRQIKIFDSNKNSIYKRDILFSSIMILVLLSLYFYNISYILYFVIFMSFFSIIIYLKRSENLL